MLSGMFERQVRGDNSIETDASDLVFPLDVYSQAENIS